MIGEKMHTVIVRHRDDKRGRRVSYETWLTEKHSLDLVSPDGDDIRHTIHRNGKETIVTRYATLAGDRITVTETTEI